MSAAAFFDLDRTMMSGSSTYYFGKAALKWGMYSRSDVVKDAWKAFWFRRAGASDAKSNGVRDHVLEAVRGHYRKEMEVLIPDVLGPILDRVYPEMYERLLEHEASGVPTYLCSASPVEIVGRVASVLNMTGGALATTAAVDDEGIYNGSLVGPFCYGEGKAEAMRAEAGLAGIDLEKSWAYGDSVSDLPMLEAVGNPVVVNPDRQLKEIAEARGWEVLRFEPRHGLRAAVGAGLTAGGVAVGVGAALWATRKSRS